MSEPAIRIEGVGKRYQLGTGHEFGVNLSQRLEQAVRAPFRRLLGRGVPQAESRDEEFWALRDVSFEIESGSAIGLIGANGSGKSTLLKLLSRITVPTEGRITVRGRVGTLLEVGTGFHPELTGRENIYLNGTILGMRRTEITDRFEEIVAFSGIEQFLDTPVKRYSSGMYVRLAFSVAAHLQPEVLLVDEVLAVGDTEFQQKCLGKMGDVARQGRTVVFVSHNLSAVQRLCARSVWLDHGQMMETGPTQDVIASYLTRAGAQQLGGQAEVGEAAHRVGTGDARLIRVAMLDGDGRPMDRVQLGQPFKVEMTFEVKKPIEETTVEVGICSADGTRAVTVLSGDDGTPSLSLEPGTHKIAAEIETTLLPGDYWVEVGIHPPGHTYDYVERVLNFASINVPHGDVSPYPWATTRGVVRAPSRWTIDSPMRAGIDSAQP